ncbi:hypothetical protein DEO72_LG4g642 [Vigna unguiculata]|uniref:Uncharacterized protein n=1 Tax=Vigna unguiculata TaxID=3917 RepID=A0A4D6LN97_VIGUN|nr:hypothetical protein DEO72_LG4g642 [Vigna unguiculata]
MLTFGVTLPDVKGCWLLHNLMFFNVYQLRRRPAAAALCRASSPPLRHPLSSIKLSPLATGEFKKCVSFAFLIRLCCFGVHRFSVPNTSLPRHEDTPQAKKFLYHRNPPLNQVDHVCRVMTCVSLDEWPTTTMKNYCVSRRPPLLQELQIFYRMASVHIRTEAEE